MTAMARRDGSPAGTSELLFRDDQIDPLRLTDEIRRLRRSGRRAALIDSGVYGLNDLEWLAEEQIILYSSDAAGRSGPDLVRIGEDVRKAGGAALYLVAGPWDGDAGRPRPAFEDLVLMGRSGWDLHVSNRERERDPGRLAELSRACREGGGFLVYYHTGPLGPWLEDLAGNGAWIHLTEDSLAKDEDILTIKDAAEAAARGGTGVILHAPKAGSVGRIKDAVRAGVLLRLETPPSDYRSPLRELEAVSAKTRLGPRAFYLDPSVLP
ncbi:MAG: hypothetical protein JW742_09300 [Candidatus Aminicenantes bacterium]|nr:hypothetical protein [Candidatus Aminicenantes bacterium]